eukprot:TRINITY_DN66460_c0_g1_i1.p2 TRINITY_DN66460_c0_g1~~TRINITY_DN66460_c0_g1_i1.p2  ORF type:complete len:118 (-),score=37.91 TRINITY_DN66460_c0_g1_i1:16-369(-)
MRYFNKGTGYGGKPYRKKTDDSMDAELGDEKRMMEFVTEKSGTSQCDVVWGDGCSEMELKYIGKQVGFNVPRDKNKMMQEKQKWEQELQINKGVFAQNKQRVVLLDRLISNFENPEL